MGKAKNRLTSYELQSVEFPFVASGIREETKRALERKSEIERIPPVLTSAPETRNGCKPVFKKRRAVGRGSWRGVRKLI